MWQKISIICWCCSMTLFAIYIMSFIFTLLCDTWNYKLRLLRIIIKWYALDIPDTWRRPTPAICDLRHSALFTISCNRRIAFFRKFLRDCTRCSPFAWVDYDAKRASATGATISMQMSRRATNTKPARVAVLLDRTAPQI